MYIYNCDCSPSSRVEERISQTNNEDIDLTTYKHCV